MQKRDFFALSAICTLQFFNVNDSALKKTVQLLSCMKKKL